jgi:hypothetical protein
MLDAVPTRLAEVLEPLKAHLTMGEGNALT